MPKIYSEAQREKIKQALLEQAAYCLTHDGVKGTTVDKLVSFVHIPKGTFYLFYPSKEALIFEVLLQYHETMEENIRSNLKQFKYKHDVDEITQLILSFFKQVDNSQYIKILTSIDINTMFQKLPKEMLEQHFQQDQNFLSFMFKALNIAGTKDIKLFQKAFTSLFLSMIANHDVKDETYYDSLALCIRGLVIQMLS